MQFSIKTLLIIQAVVAVLCFIGGHVNLFLLCIALFPFTWLIATIWGTVRIASRNGSDNLFFYRSQPAEPQHQQKMPVDAARFLDVVNASGLVSRELFDEFQHCHSAEAWETLSADPKLLAEELIEQHLLTRWQADLLLAGKYKGFFLNKYKLLSCLGIGGSTSIYLAEQANTLKQFALKVLPKSKADNPAVVATFISTAQLTAIINHPRIIQGHDIDQAAGTYYLVLDYEPGMDILRLVSEHGPLDCVTAVKYLAQATDGVERLHKMGKVYCDLKPDHLYLTEDHGIKILGLGMVRSLDDISGTIVEDLTFEFETADFLAPELAFDPKQVSPATDIYSLGCILYYLLSNRYPYREHTLMPKGVRAAPDTQQSKVVTMRLHQTAPIPAIEPYLENAPNPARLMAIYERMMAKSPADRYPDAGILFKDLEDYLHEAGETVD